MLTQEQIVELKLNVKKIINDDQLMFHIDLSEEIENKSFDEADDTQLLKDELIDPFINEIFQKLWKEEYPEFITWNKYSTQLHSNTVIEFNFEPKQYGNCSLCGYKFTIQTSSFNKSDYDQLSHASDEYIAECLEFRHYLASEECKEINIEKFNKLDKD